MGIEFSYVSAANVMAVINLIASPNILLWIPNTLITREVCVAAVKANGLALKDVPGIYMTRDVCLAAINQNHQAFWSFQMTLLMNSH